MDADVRIASASGTIKVLAFAFDGELSPVALSLVDTAMAAAIASFPDGGDAPITKFALPTNTWAHLTLRIERSGATSTLVAKLNGVQVSSIDGLALPAAQHKIAFGLVSTAITGAASLDLDNFALTLE